MCIKFFILAFDGLNILHNPQKWHIQLTISNILSQMPRIGIELKEKNIFGENTRNKHKFFIFFHGNATLFLAHLMTKS